MLSAERAASGAAVVLATHDLAFAALVADRVTMLFDGEAVCTEPAAAFFADNLFYRPVEDAFARRWLDGGDGQGRHEPWLPLGTAWSARSPRARCRFLPS